MLAGLFRPTAGDEASRLLAGVLRDSADPATAADYLAAAYTANVSALLPQVVAPALVLHYRADRLIPFRGGQQLAAGLPDAQFVALQGAYHLPDAHDLDTVADAVVTFLSRSELS